MQFSINQYAHRHHRPFASVSRSRFRHHHVSQFTAYAQITIANNCNTFFTNNNNRTMAVRSTSFFTNFSLPTIPPGSTTITGSVFQYHHYQVNTIGLWITTTQFRQFNNALPSPFPAGSPRVLPITSSVIVNNLTTIAFGVRQQNSLPLFPSGLQ